MDQTMKAVVRDAYGSVDVLRVGDTAEPVADEGEVLVRVLAAGVDQGAWHLMAGMPYVMRLAGFGIRAPKNPLLGYDVAGRVEAVGPNARPFRPGDEVSGLAVVPSPSMRLPALIVWRRSQTRSASSRPLPPRSLDTPPCRRFATTARSRPVSAS
jgi:NADPH:quinone reductase-like Zn-dependent oxidoreductase